MTRKTLFSRAVFAGTALAAVLGVIVTDTGNAQVPRPRNLSAEPIRIVRQPAALKFVARAPITNRVWLRSDYARILTGATIFTPAVPHAAPPGKRALVIILENSGVMKNIDSDLPNRLNVNINTVTCGDWEFELRVGESIASLVSRVLGQLGGNLTCINPASWHQTTFNPYNWLDEQSDLMLENAVKGTHSLINTQSRYDRVVVMEDEDATPARVLTIIRSLESEYVIDIHVLTHGGDNFFVGHNGAYFTDANFFAPLQADVTAKKLYLRAVYQMNCVSGTLKDNWTALGAVAVNGTARQYNNSMPHQYFSFLQYWLNSPPGLKGMEDASRKSFEDTAAFTRPIYNLIGMGNKVDQSRLTSTGSNSNARVNSAL